MPSVVQSVNLIGLIGSLVINDYNQKKTVLTITPEAMKVAEDIKGLKAEYENLLTFVNEDGKRVE